MPTGKTNLNCMCLVVNSTYAVIAKEVLRTSIGNCLETQFPVPSQKYQELLEKENRMEQKAL